MKVIEAFIIGKIQGGKRKGEEYIKIKRVIFGELQKILEERLRLEIRF